MHALMRLSQKLPLKAKRLTPGATIGVAAPASPFKREELMQGLSILHAMGYATRLADGLFKMNGYLAGHDQQRADQLHALFLDDRVDAVMCARGGFGSLRILTLLDYALIAAHPKPFVGFSDITALHQAFFAHTGLVTFHGPMVCTLSRSDPQTRVTWEQVLCGAGPQGPLIGNHRTLKPGKSQGLFLGGNLATLCHLLGTPFAYKYEGCILFIEETGEAPYRIDRMLVQMKLSGCFENLAGLVLGSFKDCGVEAEIDALVRQLFDDSATPILAGVNAGHGNCNLTLPLGIMAALDTDRGELRFLETAVV
ncbi:MAG: LD-carboxypeptidase [Desulfobacteraceae bacterium]|nr:MAG: LD-carboxypeptidase [Desulfobacteraceae bacterium]